MSTLSPQVDSQLDVLESPDYGSNRMHPNIGMRQHRTSDAVHNLMGPEIQKAPSVRETMDRIQETGHPEGKWTAANYRQRANPSEPQTANQPENPFTHPRGTGVETLQAPEVPDEIILKNSLSAGVTAGGVSLTTSALGEGVLLTLQGASTLGAAVAAAPLAGGALGYMAGKRFGHPIVGAAAGAATTTIGTAVALNTAFGGTMAGALSGASIITTAGPVVLGGALTYGLGKIHERMWSKNSGKDSSLLWTYVKGATIAPFTVPAGAIYYGSRGIYRAIRGKRD